MESQVFDSMTIVEIGCQFKRDDRAAIAWCHQYGLLANNYICQNCNVDCREGLYGRAVDGIVWCCPNCRGSSSIRKGSFMEGSRLKIWQILGLTYLWATSAGRSRGLSVEQTMKELDVDGKQTITDWSQYCRDVAVEFFLGNPERLGGQGRIVEIDESLFARRKYHRGHLVAEQWIMVAMMSQQSVAF